MPRGITRVKASSMLENTAVAGNIANASLNNITAIPTSIDVGSMTLLQTQTASASASLEFSMDSTYDSYVFKWINCHPSTDAARLQFNLSIDNGSNYNVTKTTTAFRAVHREDDASTELAYRTPTDLAQSTGYQDLITSCGNDNDQASSGTLQIFSPSSTTFVKHFIATSQSIHESNISMNLYVAGYGNTTSPITNIKFIMSSGNIDDGTIKMYGVA